MSDPARRRRLERNIDTLAERVSDLLVEVQPVEGTRPKAAVVGWDLAHNPVGRAHVLYRLLDPEWEVHLIGPMWRRFGDHLWEPLEGERLFLTAFAASSVLDYLPRALAAATREDYDLVICGKHRLPSVHLATMVAEWSDAPLIIDVDDDERAFADEIDPAHRDPSGATPITQMLDTRAGALAEECIADTDGVLVVSPPLQERFGGIIVRHARESGEPVGTARQITERATTRFRCGIAEEEKAIFFVGTVRPHKGVQEIVGALDRLDRDDVRLHVFTTTADDEVDRLVAARVPGATHRYVTHGPTRLAELRTLLGAADLVVLAQEQESQVSRYQVPAKVSDATAAGCPVLVPASPVFEDLAALGLVETYEPGTLADRLGALLDRPRDLTRARMLQERFEDVLSVQANRARLDRAVGIAVEHHAAREAPRPARVHEPVIEHLRFRRDAEGVDPTPVPEPREGLDPDRAVYDIAFFWKQNDTGLYGRRSDMLVQQSFELGRVRRAVHFDAPVRLNDLHQRLQPPERSLPAEADHVLNNVLERHLRWADVPRLHRRCFLHRDVEQAGARLFGEPVPTMDEYASFVLAELNAAGMDPATTIAWVWPVSPGFAGLLEEIGFGAVVCDLVDDQRTWPNLSPDYAELLDHSYRAVVGAADLVLTNTPANAAAFEDLGKGIAVVPNGAELADAVPAEAPEPEGLGDGPVIGYVGNMRDRIDWDLLEHVASARPGWNIVLVGEMEVGSRALDLAARHANVHLLGVVPYRQARALMARFDVGIVPHTISDQSMRMDPLKLYNFVALGVPVVSTAHPTALGFASGVLIAESGDRFVAAVERQLAAPRPDASKVDELERISWRRRAEGIFAMIDGLNAPAARAGGGG